MLPDNIRISVTFDRTNIPFCLNGAKGEYTVFGLNFTSSYTKFYSTVEVCYFFPDKVNGNQIDCIETARN